MTPGAVLMAAVEAFLRDELATQTGAYTAYQARIAANLLALLRREAEIGATLQALDREFARERGLDAASIPAGVARALRDAAIDESTALFDYLRLRSLLALAIDNPRYSGYRQAREAWPESVAALDALIASASDGDDNSV